MSVKSRLKKFAESQKITVSDFEKSIGVSNGYVNSISKSIGIEKICLLLENYPNVNLEWLFTGKGEMYKREDGARFVEIVAGKNLSVEELRREYLRLKELERVFNVLNENNIDIAASPVPLYGNPYTVIEEFKNSIIQYKKDIEWYKQELDKKQSMIDVLLSGSVTVQKNVG